MVPSLGGAAAEDLSELRQACVTAISRVAATQPETTLVLGAVETSSVYSPVDFGDLAALGVPEQVHLGSPACGGAPTLPSAFTVGAWLVKQALGVRSLAQGFGVGEDFDASHAAQQLMDLVMRSRTALIVLGDGSARRDKTSPGYFDERAVNFDSYVVHALRTGDHRALSELDLVLGRDLLASGTNVWRVAGALFDGSDVDATLHHVEAPFGVGYLVASWLTRQGSSASQPGHHASV